MKTIKKHAGNYEVYINNILVGSIDKLETGEWVCYDKYNRAFEMCQTKRYALTQF